MSRFEVHLQRHHISLHAILCLITSEASDLESLQEKITQKANGRGKKKGKF